MSELSLMIAATAAKVFADASPADGFEAALWRRVEEAGLDRVLMPEDHGGAGDAFEAAVAIACAAGAAAVSVPICETLLANWALATAGIEVNAGPKAIWLDEGRLLRRAPAGFSSPLPERARGGDDDQGAAGVADAPSTTLPHKVGESANAAVANSVVWQPSATQTVAITADGLNACAVGSAMCEGKIIASVAGEPCMQAELVLLAHDRRTLPLPISMPMALYATLVAASLFGAMQSINAITFEYANTRKQFGRTLGAFQAIQHMAAKMAEDAAATEAAVTVAARELNTRGRAHESDPDRSLWHAAVAKGRASEAAGKIAAGAHQIHGAIGFTREHTLHRYTRRLWAWRDRAGSEQHWYEVIGQAALATGHDGLWPGITSGLKL